MNSECGTCQPQVLSETGKNPICSFIIVMLVIVTVDIKLVIELNCI